MTNEEKLLKRIDHLKSELEASMRREQLLSDDLKFSEYLKKKISKTKIYKTAKNPNSKIGKILRAPRTLIRIAKNPAVVEEIRKKKDTIKINPIILEPWKLSLEDRIKIFDNAKKQGKKIALYYVEKFDSSTFRYRCYNTMRATLLSKKWQVVYFGKNEVNTAIDNIPKVNILVFGRQSEHDKNISQLAAAASNNGIPAVFDIDDLVFDASNLDNFLDAIGEKDNMTYWAGYIAGVEKICNRGDCFISTNDFLKEKLIKKYDKRCFVIPNTLNEEQIQATEAYLELKGDELKNHFTIGYFSGSPTHAKDLALAMPSILKFLEEHKDAKLLVVGYMKFGKEAEKFLKNGQIEFSGMVDFRKLQKLNASVSVNLAPLVENDFTNCKSELKFFEAAIAETVTLASPTYAFKNSIIDGKTGFLCTGNEWYDRLEYLYSHPEENRKIARAAKKYCLEYYYGEKILKTIEDVYDEILKQCKK